MSRQSISDRLASGVLDIRVELTLEELSELAHVERTLVLEMVEEGVLVPRGETPEQWRFPGPALARLQRGLRLQRDLGLNLAGVALALDLLDELQALRARLHRLQGGWAGD